MRWLVLLLTLTAFATEGCGGKVQFVSDQAQKDLPGQPTESHVVSESFRYGQPIGTQVVVLGLYPRKSMRAARERAVQFLPAFLDAVWNGAEGYQGMHFAVLRDVMTANIEWYSPSEAGLPRPEWKEESLQFLRDNLTNLAIEKNPGESDSLTPFDSFQKIVHIAASRISAKQGPIWLNFYYLRDGDLAVSSSQKEAVDNSVKSFKDNLRLVPLSPFRSAVHLVSYLSEGGECDPLPSRISRVLLGYLDPFNHHAEELCNLLSMNPASPNSAMERLGGQVHALDRRMILEQVPRLETLQVSINGSPIPREQIVFVEANNEILFRQNVSPTPVMGDEIRVSYEAAKQ